MKPLIRSFQMFIRQIAQDSMLAAVCIAPILAACFFRFGIPFAEKLLCGAFHMQTILSNYYLLFDLFLAVLAPYMVCFASALVMLTEYDENMTAYMALTPVGKRGYILSRLAFPAALSFIVSSILLPVFSLTRWQLPLVLLVCLLSSGLSMIVSLLIFSFSHNRVEGMAMAKMSGLMMLGLFVPFFLTTDAQYLCSPLPSFWIAKICREGNALFAVPALFTGAIWVKLLYAKFMKKLV